MVQNNTLANFGEERELTTMIRPAKPFLVFRKIHRLSMTVWSFIRQKLSVSEHGLVNNWTLN